MVRLLRAVSFLTHEGDEVGERVLAATWRHNPTSSSSIFVVIFAWTAAAVRLSRASRTTATAATICRAVEGSRGQSGVLGRETCGKRNKS